MPLPDADIVYLSEKQLKYELSVESNMTCIVLPNWRLPVGYDREASDLLLRLSAGYPDVAPDMWWFNPAVRLADGRVVQATEATEQHLGRTWQRWSRHFSAGLWQSGIDGLESFLALIRREVERCVGH